MAKRIQLMDGDKGTSCDTSDEQANKHTCEICGATFPGPSLLKDHRDSHLKGKNNQHSLQCHICLRFFASRSALSQHRIKHSSRYQCDHCRNIFGSAHYLNVHVERHCGNANESNASLGTKPQKCSFCPDTFSSVAGLTRHANLIHKAELERAEYGRNSSMDITSFDKTAHANKANEKIPRKDSGLPANQDTKDADQDKSAHEKSPRKDSELPANQDTKDADEVKSAHEKSPRKDSALPAIPDAQDADEDKSAKVIASGATYECLICSKTYDKSKSLDLHLIKHTNRYNCESCGQTFSDTTSFENHLRRHLGVKPCECTVCKAAFVSKSALSKHMRIHAEREHKCDECGRKFLKKIWRVEIPNKPNKCPSCLGTKPEKCVFCPETFSSVPGLMRHTNRVHKAELERDGYKQNSSKDITSDDQNTHRTKTNGNIPRKGSGILKNGSAQNTEERKSAELLRSGALYECLICSNVFGSSKGLDNHLIRHTNRYECDHCGLTFSYANSLELHVRRHLGIKPHQCTVCKTAFADKGILRKHMRTHNKLEHKCDKCEREFPTKKTLDNHRNSHLRLRPHKCSFCPAAFKVISSLMKHTNSQHKSKNQRIDNEGKASDEVKSAPVISGCPPYVCPVCTKVYAARPSLIHHLVSHTNRHKCEYCDKGFTSAAHLKRHSRVHPTRKKEITTEMDRPNSRSVLKDKPVEISSADSTVQMEAQDSVLKDAICLEDEREFKPTVEIADEAMTLQASDCEADAGEPKQGSEKAGYPRGENDILNGETPEKLKSGCKVGTKKTELLGGDRNMITSFRPIKVTLPGLQHPS